MKWHVTKDQENQMLREYLKDVQGFSRRLIKIIKFQGGSLAVNGEYTTVRRVLKAGDLVEVTFPPEYQGGFMKAEAMPLHIVYEDQDVIVINKPAGIATIPSLHHKTGTLANGILHHYQKQMLEYTVHVVTRLDRDTSGLLLVAKHRLSHSMLAREQKAGRIARRYQAIVSGHLADKEGTINQAIARKPDSIIERMVDGTGKRAITHYQVLDETEKNSLVGIRLETGRTHQIRVHFSYIGHPLLGDTLYGGDQDRLTRQALHCVSLSFIHPMTKRQLTFRSPLPNDMQMIMPAKIK